jgi:uncharacterized protein
VIIKNLKNNSILATQTMVARTFFSRARGLLGVRALADGQGLMITRCNSIHMFFMKFPIDAVFLDRSARVVGVVKHIKPNRLSPVFWKADKVIELPAGTIDRTQTSMGDPIQIIA